MLLRGIITFIWVAIVIAVLLAPPRLEAREYRSMLETEYARIVGGAGYGYCEFNRFGRRIHVRAHVAGMDLSSVGTAWIFVDGVNVGQLDGTIATDTGDAAFHGSFRAPRGAELKIDIRDHRISIETIGNAPNDPAADETLIRELTTPAAAMVGVCSTQFE